MVHFAVYGGTVAEQRDARGAHDLVFGADDQGDKLLLLAPGIFSGGGGTPVSSWYGQFASLLLKALARIPAVGGPATGKTLRSHRASDQYLRRLWNTGLAILAKQSAEYQTAFWSPAQRGVFRTRIAKLRDVASDAELLAMNMLGADVELVSMVAGVDQPSASSMPRWWKAAEWRRGSLADEEDGTLGIPALAELYSVRRSGGMTLPLVLLTTRTPGLLRRPPRRHPSARRRLPATRRTPGRASCRRSRPARCSFTSPAADGRRSWTTGAAPRLSS